MCVCVCVCVCVFAVVFFFGGGGGGGVWCFYFFLIEFFSDSKFSDVEFLSLTSETHPHRFLLKDEKHPSKIDPYAFARSAHQNGYSCWS